VASQPGLTFSNPVVAMVFGVVVFGEQVRTGGWITLAFAPSNGSPGSSRSFTSQAEKRRSDR
jgi:hypothetical protein